MPGDAADDRTLLHEAADEGRIAGDNAGCWPDVRLRPRRAPLAVVFSEPQMTLAGATHAELVASAPSSRSAKCRSPTRAAAGSWVAIKVCSCFCRRRRITGLLSSVRTGSAIHRFIIACPATEHWRLRCFSTGGRSRTIHLVKRRRQTERRAGLLASHRGARWSRLTHHIKAESMKAIWHGAVVAEGADTVEVEGKVLFPLSSLNRPYVQDSSARSVCPWKGQAGHLSLMVDDAVNAAAAWYYPSPLPGAEHVTDRLAFWHDMQVVA